MRERIFVLSLFTIDALRSNLFKVAGKMVTASVCHGGPGLPVFPKAVYSYIKDPHPDNIIDDISKEDVVDMEVIEAVSKVKSMTCIFKTRGLRLWTFEIEFVAKERVNIK